MHGIRHAEDGEEEDDEGLPARLGRGWLGALHRPSVDEVAELTAHRALLRRTASEEVAHPPHEVSEQQDEFPIDPRSLIQRMAWMMAPQPFSGIRYFADG